MANAASIAEIYNQGIDSGEATFETKPRSADQVREWFDRKSVVIVAIEASVVVGFAAVFRYRPRDCYRGVGEFSIYMHEDHRGKGQGRRLMRELLESCRNAGYWKLVSRVFPENLACRSLLKGLRFREVGVYERHAQLHGVWRDVIIVEKLL